MAGQAGAAPPARVERQAHVVAHIDACDAATDGTARSASATTCASSATTRSATARRSPPQAPPTTPRPGAGPPRWCSIPTPAPCGSATPASAARRTPTRPQGWATGTSAAAGWVTVDNPDRAPGEPTTWQQASAKGAARIVRGEGIWYGNGVIYVVSTSGGPAGQGQVFAYDPVAATFTCVFASPLGRGAERTRHITVSPRGGLVLCEDGSGRQFMHGLTPDGDIFPFAENNVVLTPELRDEKGYGGTDYTGSEWAGATFEPNSGNWLFACIQSPGVTVAIAGRRPSRPSRPWRDGGRGRRITACRPSSGSAPDRCAGEGRGHLGDTLRRRSRTRRLAGRRSVA
jgi:hypothetical protein